MAKDADTDTRPTDAFGRVLHRICSGLAVFGGLLACGMAVMVTVSVTGRYLFSAPVPGDYDLVGIIAGCAVFAFLPYCQLVRGNVVVDFFTTNVSARGKAVLDAAGSLFYLVVAIVFTWRMYFGMLELRDNNEQIAAFRFYRWSTMPLNILCMIVLIVVIAYTLTRDIDDVRTGRHVSVKSAVKGE
jgi:TRAP-type C4-dicarboxylate transport system permease small subunit